MATQEQWEVMKEWAEHMSPIGATLLELRAKVEALEAAQHTHPEQPDAPPGPAPAGGLVEMLVNLLGHYGDGTARAAIRGVADWLQQRTDTIANGSQWADLLREEAGR
jgi:hypothetical protein